MPTRSHPRPSPAPCQPAPRLHRGKRPGLALVALLLLGPALVASGGSPAWALEPQGEAGGVKPLDRDLAAISQGANRFALELYKHLASDKKGKGLFVSPASIHIALAMTALGAGGTTEEEMRRVLHLSAKGDGLLAALRERRERLGKAALTSVEKDGKIVQEPAYELSIANALWGQRGFPLRKEYLDGVRDAFGARLDLLDFARADEAAKTINDWVEEATRERIQDLIDPSLLDADTRLVLTNAIYFKSAWAHPFSKGATKPLPFRLADGGTVEAPHMRLEEDFRYLEEDGLQVVELPYSGGDLAMLIALPATPDGLAKLEEKLGVEALARWSKKLQSRPVVVTLPRFRMETELDAVPPLQALGMKAAFNPTVADFSRMTEAERLFVSAVVHKAFVTVDEEGTEAAAATAVIMTRAAAVEEPREPAVFTADRPFLFLIRHRRTDTILFTGRVMDPS